MILEAIIFGAAAGGAVLIVNVTTKFMRWLNSDKPSLGDYQPEPVAVRPRKDLLPNSVEMERRAAARSNSSTTSNLPLILFDQTSWSGSGSTSGSTSCDHHSGHHHSSGGHHHSGYDSGSSGSDSGSYGGGSCD